MDVMSKLTDEQKEKFEQLYTETVCCPFNITSIKEKDEFYNKHIFDSVAFFYLQALPISATLMDIGSGGGFPGLPIAIIKPAWSITLIESVKKKCDYMRKTVNALGLDNVEVINKRAETIKDKTCRIITSKGVGTVKKILELTLNLSMEETCWLMYKGTNLEQELKDATPILNKRGLKSEIIRFEKPFTRSYLLLRPFSSGLRG
jgi:16S rRNA (guanine527-N7)-methyltransferase